MVGDSAGPQARVASLGTSLERLGSVRGPSHGSESERRARLAEEIWRQANPRRPQLQPGSPARSRTHRACPGSAAPSGLDREDAPPELARWGRSNRPATGWPAPSRFACEEAVCRKQPDMSSGRETSSGLARMASRAGRILRVRLDGHAGRGIRDLVHFRPKSRLVAAAGWIRRRYCTSSVLFGATGTAADRRRLVAMLRAPAFGCGAHGSATQRWRGNTVAWDLRIPCSRWSFRSRAAKVQPEWPSGHDGSIGAGSLRRQRAAMPQSSGSSESRQSSVAVPSRGRTVATDLRIHGRGDAPPLNAEPHHTGLRACSEAAMQPAGSHRPPVLEAGGTEGRAAQHSGARLLPAGRHMLELAQHGSQRGLQAYLGAPGHDPWKGWQNRWCFGTCWRSRLCRRNLGERSVGTGGRGRVMDEDGISASAQGTSTGSGPCRLLREHRTVCSRSPSGQPERTRGSRFGGWAGPGRVSGLQHAGARLKVVDEVARRFCTANASLCAA